MTDHTANPPTQFRTSKKITCTCDGCGSNFLRYPSAVQPGGKTYCSVACRRKRIDCTCLTCGELFWAYTAEVKSGTAKYCSKKCMYTSHGRKPEIRDDGTAMIPLTQGFHAIVDAVDLPLLEGRSWCVRQSGDRPYAVANIGKRVTRMHHVLIKPPAGMVIDHINGDSLDNRRENLRVCTHQQNMCNVAVRKGRVFKGVTEFPKGRYIARIASEHLGTFDSAEDAARAYDNAAIERFGEFARLNFRPQEDNK